MTSKCEKYAGLDMRTLMKCYIFSGFLTGTLQTHARKYNMPIDHLSFEFKVIPEYRTQEEVFDAQQVQTFGQELPMDKVSILLYCIQCIFMFFVCLFFHLLPFITHHNINIF